MTYTKTYGSDVAGLVFVDASHPDQVQRFKGVLPDAAGGYAPAQPDAGRDTEANVEVEA